MASDPFAPLSARDGPDRSDASAPRLGFGVSGVHGAALIPRGHTARLVLRAVERGIRVFDTGPSYGGGEAERRLGAALAKIDRDTVWISTKAGVAGSSLSGLRRDFSPGAIETSLRESLTRLSVQGVDGFFLHGAGPTELTDALLDRLDTLKSAGAFRHLGIAGRGAELTAAVETGRFSLLMAPVHPWLDQSDRERLEHARAKGLGVIAIETAGPGPAPLAIPRRASDLYPFAKAIRRASRKQPADPRRLPVPEGLRQALLDKLTDVVLTTTSRLRHLDQNAALRDSLRTP